MHMDRVIFDLKTSIEATSLYILVCAFMDQGERPTISLVRTKWTGTDETLFKAVKELVQRGVLEDVKELTDDEPLLVTPSSTWHSLH